MQRSNRQSNGRRNYTRNSNAFKFHNFVFNEDNQSFCLEEQHGNKKITVLHWKKSEDRLLPEEEEDEAEIEADSMPTTKSGKTISRQLSKTSSDSTSATKRRTHEVTTSASFPPPSGRPPPATTASLTALSSSPSCSSHSVQSALPPSTSPSLSSLSQVASLGHLQTDHSTSLSPYLSQMRYHPLTKSTASSSSIATSSSSSSSQVANWLNQSLNDLDLTELPNRLFPATSRRKPAQVRRIVVDVESDNDQAEDSDKEEMSGPSEAKNNNLFQTYRRYLEKFDQPEDEQTQPLDLSVKTTRDRNNNNTHHWNIDSILGLTPFGKSEDDESDSVRSFGSSNSKFHWLKRDDDRFSSDVRFTPDWDRPLHRTSSVRSEAISPSALISSVKCCSPPSSHSSSTLGRGSTSATALNPFLFSSPLLSHTASPSSRSSRRHILSPDRTPSTPAPAASSSSSSCMFDAFLEEEISKMLQSTSKPSSRAAAAKSEYDDIEERIEDKLRSLHREVLSRKDAFEGNLERAGQDHLKLHFKLDANRNLEPYGAEGKRTLSEPCLQSLHTPAFLPSKGRPSQRNQIKRQLEDAFKQNGFLVKTKQVSDASNSATFCKFRQLRKYTRYYLKSWQSHLPDEVNALNKLWKGFLPPKTEQYLGPPTAPSPESSSSSSSNC